MASALKNLSKYDDSNIIDAAPFKFAIAVSEWNSEITHKLYEGCYETLVKHGAKPEHITTVQVPGTFELPTAAKNLASIDRVAAIICIGCVIQGETKHNDYINNAVANALANMGVVSGLPIIFGVLTPNDHQQAVDRAGGKYGNKGIEAAVTALRMVEMREKFRKASQNIGF